MKSIRVALSAFILSLTGVANGVEVPCKNHYLLAERCEMQAPTDAWRWQKAGEMRVARTGHTATLLPDGRVLVVGGVWPGDATPEIYDPVTDRWSDTSPMAFPDRSGHGAVLLDDGRVLVVGGIDAWRSAEIYDPSADRWTPTQPMVNERGYATTTLLSDGRVLVTGGLQSYRFEAMQTAEMFDPRANSWKPVASMTRARVHHAAAKLADGRVAVIAGRWGFECPGSDDEIGWTSAVELYDPASNRWAAGGNITHGDEDYASVTLRDGSVAVIGGPNDLGLERFVPEKGWSERTVLGERWHATTIALADDSILVAGGIDWSESLSSASIFDTVRGEWRDATPLPEGRANATATLLSDGSVLLVGGYTFARSPANITSGSRYNTALRFGPPR